MENLIYLIPLLGIVGLVIMVVKSLWVSKQNAGDDNMKELAGYISKGGNGLS